MTDTGASDKAAVQPKAGYHHGDLREALVAAAYQLVNEEGAENFSLADACRIAGVSTAAPYRHFKDRDEIMAEVTARGFDTMTARSMRAVEEHGEGTLEGIVAMGQAYVAFAVEQSGLFRLMFGQAPSLADAEPVVEMGNCCFSYLIEQITKYCAANGLERDADEIAVKLWTFVHGASSLLIDGKYERMAPNADIDAMIASATPQLIGKPE
ncbi:MAG: TetR/AcrR family transcriptional regulator [Pseudomonadota bacterium]